MIAPVDRFDGDFDLLPFAAQIRYRQVDSCPDFQSVAVEMSADLDVYPEAHWFLEASRERHLRPCCVFDDVTLKAIARRVAQRLYRRAAEQ